MSRDREADELITAIELHAPDRIEAALVNGDATAPVRGKTPMQWLTEMYTRSDRFADCVRVLLTHGGSCGDPALTSVLLDDGDALREQVQRDPSLLQRRTSLVSAFTPLDGATLLHIAAEYGNIIAARTLLSCGAAVDATAALDAHGLGGHTPLFHTVNSNANRSAPIMRLLLKAGADPLFRVNGLSWGCGFDWETTWFDLTPLSYAQLGLMPQMHRDERQIRDNVHELLAAAGRTPPPDNNVPNRYLAK